MWSIKVFIMTTIVAHLMAKIKANVCECDCKMKRLYTRAEGGKGWDARGWLCDCGCGCICLDEGEWSIIECDTGCCEPDPSCC